MQVHCIYYLKRQEDVEYCIFHSVIGSENSQHRLNHSDTKLKPFLIQSLEFSCALGNSAVRFHRLLVVFPFDATGVVIIVSKCTLWLSDGQITLRLYRLPPSLC